VWGKQQIFIRAIARFLSPDSVPVKDLFAWFRSCSPVPTSSPTIRAHLWWPAEKLLVFADLHFEKGSSFAARTTQLLPPYDTHATLKADAGRG
jgi:hypothetical protein